MGYYNKDTKPSIWEVRARTGTIISFAFIMLFGVIAIWTGDDRVSGTAALMIAPTAAFGIWWGVQAAIRTDF